jgi:N-acetylmuramic acid 6-phosphate etherase
MLVTGLGYEEATATLAKTDGHVKTALVMILGQVSAEEATERLTRASGFVRAAIEGRAYTPEV